MNITLQKDLCEQIDQLKEVAHELREIENQADKTVKAIKFISTDEFSKITGWSTPTVLKVFNRPDFPSTDFGKEKLVEVNALIKYFSIPRRKAVN